MSVIEEVRSDREDLARVLKKHTGIRKLVEELYPDSAHFIYELLQNAEDTGATEARFTLSRTNLVFEHDGRPFERRDIFGITDIGEGTKAHDDDKIGRFGVGFKAVFAYSETPLCARTAEHDASRRSRASGGRTANVISENTSTSARSASASAASIPVSANMWRAALSLRQ